MKWSEVERLPTDIDLDALVMTLNRFGIDHEINRENDVTRLWIKDAASLDQVHEMIVQVQRMTKLDSKMALKKPPNKLLMRAYFKRLPITILALFLCSLGTLMVSYFPDFVSSFTFQSYSIINEREITFEPLSVALGRDEWWRLITPAFLHFGIFHIVFNGLWLWEFGRRLELFMGSGAYFILLSALAIGSNVGQYLWDGPSLFGGFSGVVYGLLGYLWIRGKRVAHPLLKLQPSIFPLMIGWLLVCLFGVVDLFISGGVANGAHVSGLLIGVVFGLFGGQGQAKQA